MRQTERRVEGGKIGTWKDKRREEKKKLGKKESGHKRN